MRSGARDKAETSLFRSEARDKAETSLFQSEARDKTREPVKGPLISRRTSFGVRITIFKPVVISHEEDSFFLSKSF